MKIASIDHGQQVLTFRNFENIRCRPCAEFLTLGSDMKIGAISLNFDSMREAQGFPSAAQFRDESYFKVADRFFSGLGADIKISIYIIGRDLEDPEIAARVKDWASAGHEIGNHTYTHPQHFGVLREAGLADEIVRAHWAIAEVTGAPPIGFIAPGWSMPKQGYTILNQLGYRYDLSSFASPWIYAVTAKLIFNEIMCGEFANVRKTASRPDYISSLFGRGKIERVGLEGAICALNEPGLLRLPLPRTSFWSPPIWHTAGFIFGFKGLAERVKDFARRGDPFYYTMHPADLFDLTDFDSDLKPTHLERLGVSLSEKQRRFAEMVDAIKSNFELITLREMVKKIEEQVR